MNYNKNFYQTLRMFSLFFCTTSNIPVLLHNDKKFFQFSPFSFFYHSICLFTASELVQIGNFNSIFDYWKSVLECVFVLKCFKNNNNHKKLWCYESPNIIYTESSKRVLVFTPQETSRWFIVSPITFVFGI